MFLRSGKNINVSLPFIVAESKPKDIEKLRLAMEKRKATIAGKEALNEKRNLARKAAAEKRNVENEKMKKRSLVELVLYITGLETLCYHFGYCSDVIGDVWLEMYDAYGLEGLKKDLRNTSDSFHNGNSNKCIVCRENIKNLHD